MLPLLICMVLSKFTKHAWLATTVRMVQETKTPTICIAVGSYTLALLESSLWTTLSVDLSKSIYVLWFHLSGQPLSWFSSGLFEYPFLFDVICVTLSSAFYVIGFSSDEHFQFQSGCNTETVFLDFHSCCKVLGSICNEHGVLQKSSPIRMI